jgi:hypothetical protein
MDFAFAADTKKYDRIMRTIHSYRLATMFPNPGFARLINPLFSPVYNTGLQQARHMRMQPIFKLYNNWYGR